MEYYQKKYCIDPKYQSAMVRNCRCKCPRCGHTMILSVKYKSVTCDHCYKKYENNSKSYKLKKIKEMLKSEI